MGIKISTGYYQKKQRKASERGSWKISELSEEEKNKNQIEARERYQNVSKEEKERERQYCRESLSEHEKQRKAEGRKNYFITQKNNCQVP